MARPETGHRSDDIASYLSEALEPEARAELEAHLDTCEECQAETEAQKSLLPEANEALVVKPKRAPEPSGDEQVADLHKP